MLSPVPDSLKHLMVPNSGSQWEPSGDFKTWAGVWYSVGTERQGWESRLYLHLSRVLESVYKRWTSQGLETPGAQPHNRLRSKVD